MSNAVLFAAPESGFGLDAAAARRQFSLSLGVGLAVLMVAAMIDLQPSRAAADAPSNHHTQVSAPEFADSSAVAQLRRAMTAGTFVGAN
ncbi:MAG: hypothetical protein ABSC22_11310 [Roseiarcus sp.]|jgi:hypothetical protein